MIERLFAEPRPLEKLHSFVATCFMVVMHADQVTPASWCRELHAQRHAASPSRPSPSQSASLNHESRRSISVRISAMVPWASEPVSQGGLAQFYVNCKDQGPSKRPTEKFVPQTTCSYPGHNLYGMLDVDFLLIRNCTRGKGHWFVNVGGMQRRG